MDAEQTKKLKDKLCVGRCNYQFTPTQVETSVDEKTNTQLEKTKEGLLYCTVCTHSQDIEFE